MGEAMFAARQAGEIDIDQHAPIGLAERRFRGYRLRRSAARRTNSIS